VALNAIGSTAPPTRDALGRLVVCLGEEAIPAFPRKITASAKSPRRQPLYSSCEKCNVRSAD
jgi:hypothetical protein